MYCEYSTSAGSILAFDTAHILRVLAMFGVLYVLLCRTLPFSTSSLSVFDTAGALPHSQYLGVLFWGFCLPVCTGNISALLLLVLPGLCCQCSIQRDYFWWWSIARNSQRTRQIYRWELWGHKVKGKIVTPPFFEQRSVLQQRHQHSSARARRCQLS